MRALAKTRWPSNAKKSAGKHTKTLFFFSLSLSSLLRVTQSLLNVGGGTGEGGVCHFLNPKK